MKEVEARKMLKVASRQSLLYTFKVTRSSIISPVAADVHRPRREWKERERERERQRGRH